MGLICRRIPRWLYLWKVSGKAVFRRGSCAEFILAAICLALFTTAFIIIAQLTRGVNTF
ncbi:DUF2776 family protein [Escherichia coli]